MFSFLFIEFDFLKVILIVRIKRLFWCMSPNQVEAQQLLKQTVPQLRVVHLIFQTKVCHQPHCLKRQRVHSFPVCHVYAVSNISNSEVICWNRFEVFS